VCRLFHLSVMDVRSWIVRWKTAKAVLLAICLLLSSAKFAEVIDTIVHRGESGTMPSLFPFKTPFRLLVAGPSGAGKTEFVKQLIDHRSTMIDPPPENITWYYAVAQPWFPQYAHLIEFREGLPDEREVCSRANHLIILDDMAVYANKSTSQLFACDSHHRNISIVYLTQNFFQKNGVQRDISLNATHIAFFKNPRDKTQIFNLARQMFPENTKFLTSAYKDATSQPFSYLLLDLTPDAEERFRVRSNIFPGQHLTAYQPKQR
jgi:hypothetical protein